MAQASGTAGTREVFLQRHPGPDPWEAMASGWLLHAPGRRLDERVCSTGWHDLVRRGVLPFLAVIRWVGDAVPGLQKRDMDAGAAPHCDDVVRSASASKYSIQRDVSRPRSNMSPRPIPHAGVQQGNAQGSSRKVASYRGPNMCSTVNRPTQRPMALSSFAGPIITAAGATRGIPDPLPRLTGSVTPTGPGAFCDGSRGK